jgi:hypothetical protein
MTAGLEPLGNDAVHAVSFQPARLVQGGGGGENDRLPSADPRERLECAELASAFARRWVGRKGIMRMPSSLRAWINCVAW